MKILNKDSEESYNNRVSPLAAHEKFILIKSCYVIFEMNILFFIKYFL